MLERHWKAVDQQCNLFEVNFLVIPCCTSMYCNVIDEDDSEVARSVAHV